MAAGVPISPLRSSYRNRDVLPPKIRAVQLCVAGHRAALACCAKRRPPHATVLRCGVQMRGAEPVSKVTMSLQRCIEAMQGRTFVPGESAVETEFKGAVTAPVIADAAQVAGDLFAREWAVARQVPLPVAVVTCHCLHKLRGVVSAARLSLSQEADTGGREFGR